MKPNHFRIARPVSDLKRSTEMYCGGLGLSVVGSFAGHDGFDGVMLGHPGASYHFEFTVCRTEPIAPAPTHEDLAVFYVETTPEWVVMCSNMLRAGFKQVRSFNPYWDEHGRTFEDPDGYRTVLQNGTWQNA